MLVLKELNAGRYERTMVSQQEKGMQKTQHEIIFMNKATSWSCETLCLFVPFTSETNAAEKNILVPGSGQIINRDNIIK